MPAHLLTLTAHLGWVSATRIAAALMLVAAPAGAATAADDLVVGLAGPMSGRYASYGQELQAGAELAIEDLNAAGGVMGRRLVLKAEDDQCTRDGATAAAQRLVAQGVHVVVGHYCGAASYAASGIYGSAGIIQIAPIPSTTWPTAGSAPTTLFHLSPTDQRQGEVAGRSLAARSGLRVAILHDRTVYGSTLAEDVRQALRRAGREEVLFAHLRAGEKDYSAIVGQLRAIGVDVLYFGGFPTEAAIIIRQLREAGLAEAVLFAGDALATNDFWQLAEAAGEGSLLTSRYDASRHPGAADVVRRLQERGLERTGDAVRAYAAFQLWARSVSAAGRAEPAMIAERMAGGGETVLGAIAFDTSRRANVPAFAIHTWRSGRLEQLD